MNKRFLIILSLTAVLSGCNTLGEIQNKPMASDTFTATMESFDADTKTYFENNFAVWSDADEISVFQGRSHSDKYVLKSTDPALFRLEKSVTGSQEFNTNIALYPYSEAMICEESDTAYLVKGVTFPGIQYYKQNSFSEESFIMVAKTSGLDDRTLRFKNVCGGLRLKIKPLPGDTMIVKSIILEGLGSEKLSGTANVIYAKDGSISHVWTDEFKDYVKLEVPSEVMAESDLPFQCVISLPRVEFTKGFSVTINADIDGVDSTYTRTTIKPQSIKRSRFLTMPDINFGEFILMPSLSLSKKELEFTYEGGKKTLELTSNTDWTGVSDSDWVTISRKSGNGSTTLTVAVEPNHMNIPRTAVLKFAVQDIEKTVTVRQSIKPSLELSHTSASVKAGRDTVSVNLTSNVPWTATTDNVWFSVEPSSGPGSVDPVSVKIITSVNVDESPRTGSVFFNAGGLIRPFTITQKGNISVYNMKDYIDEYGINHGKGIIIDEVVWAPVNCGYHNKDFKYGRLYQWGRKYGQGYNGELHDGGMAVIGEFSDSSVPVVHEGSVIVQEGESKSNADKFYAVLSTPWDWLEFPDTKLWNSGIDDNPTKTEYDPCPEGWRVPTHAELNELYVNHSDWTSRDMQLGYWFSGSSPYSDTVPKVFLPAAGYRLNDGDASGRGYGGYYWSSCPSNDYRACYFSFNASNVGMYTHYRANAYSVRCVQDEQ